MESSSWNYTTLHEITQFYIPVTSAFMWLDDTTHIFPHAQLSESCVWPQNILSRICTFNYPPFWSTLWIGITLEGGGLDFAHFPHFPIVDSKVETDLVHRRQSHSMCTVNYVVIASCPHLRTTLNLINNLNRPFPNNEKLLYSVPTHSSGEHQILRRKVVRNSRHLIFCYYLLDACSLQTGAMPIKDIPHNGM